MGEAGALLLLCSALVDVRGDALTGVGRLAGAAPRVVPLGIATASDVSVRSAPWAKAARALPTRAIGALVEGPVPMESNTGGPRTSTES